MLSNTNMTNSNQFPDFVNFYKREGTVINPFLSKVFTEAPIFYKKGNKIRIKKKNVGSFTRYCGGNVTRECILKGKRSPSLAIRKKATFADNARSWNKKK